MAEQTTASENYNGYARLAKEVKRRWQEPNGHPTFGLFFVASFLLFAAAGIWLELVRLAISLSTDSWSVTPLRTAIATYFPAILGAAVLQLQISDALRSLRALGSIVGYAFTFLALVIVFVDPLPNWLAISLGLIGSAGALACWRIVYADDPSLRDDPEPPPPEVTTGRLDPLAALSGDDALGDYEA